MSLKANYSQISLSSSTQQIPLCNLTVHQQKKKNCVFYKAIHIDPKIMHMASTSPHITHESINTYDLVEVGVNMKCMRFNTWLMWMLARCEHIRTQNTITEEGYLIQRPL